MLYSLKAQWHKKFTNKSTEKLDKNKTEYIFKLQKRQNNIGMTILILVRIKLKGGKFGLKRIVL